MTTHVAVVCQDKGVPLDGTKGASIHLRSMAIAFARSGARVTVLAPRIGTPGWEPNLSIETIQVGASSDSIDNSRDTMASALGDIHTTHPIDAIYERLSLFANDASRWAREADVPHAVEVNAPLACEAYRHRGLVNLKMARETEEEVLIGADALFPVSPWLKRWLMNLGCGEEKITILPNGVHYEYLAGESSSFGKPKDSTSPFTIGFVGSLKPWHDLETLVESLTILPKDDFKLVIVGDGPKREWLENLSFGQLGTRRLCLSEPVSNREVLGIIDTMDLCVAPYREMDDFYFCPIKIFEYGARKRPVLVPDLPELREQFPEGAAVYYRPSDAEDLAEKIITARDRPEGAVSHVEKMFEFVKEHTWENHAQSILKRFDRAPRKVGAAK